MKTKPSYWRLVMSLAPHSIPSPSIVLKSKSPDPLLPAPFC